MSSALRVRLSGRHLPMIGEHVATGAIQHFLRKPVSQEALLSCLAVSESFSPG
jgi:hypothetical protein